MSEPIFTPRRRGAQPGNKNAAKHGFYDPSFHAVESGSLDANIMGQLADEVNLMRVLILRTAASIKDNPNLTGDQYLSYLRGITHAVGRLESIFRTRRLLDENEGDLEKALDALKYIPADED